MVEEARLEEVGSGLAPVSEGWFVVNARDAAWLTNDAFGARCMFEADVPVLRKRPELEPHRFEQLGFRLHVLEPGKPHGLYHAESNQEDFLVLAGECLLVIDGQERRLRAWDFVHCPAWTEHVFVGAEEPCLILMIGARPDDAVVYPVSEVAARHGASVARETRSPAEAYVGLPDSVPGLPEGLPVPWRRPG